MHVLFALDPGKTGAMARFDSGVLKRVYDPVDGNLSATLAEHLIDELDLFSSRLNVVIEKVNGIPGQSGPAAFNFGSGYGELLGVCRGLDVVPILVPPSVWKPAIGLRGMDKKASVAMAAKRWGTEFFHLAKHDGRAEAALLGAYWLDQRGKAAAC